MPATASAQPDDPQRPQLIAETHWDTTPEGKTLRIYPTELGRWYAGPDGEELAWEQVVALAPDAQTPGMRMQFECHWYGRGAIPNKPSWNIEPWRPVVDDAVMMFSGCNPGGPEV